MTINTIFCKLLTGQWLDSMTFFRIPTAPSAYPLYGVLPRVVITGSDPPLGSQSWWARLLCYSDLTEEGSTEADISETVSIS